MPWPAKDPETVADYRYDVALDAGDTLDAISATKLTGSVVIDSQTSNATGVTVWLSGGSDGETAVFRVAWTTTGGRTFDDIITLAVVANEIGTDVTEFLTRYPAFSSVAGGTIAYWLRDAERTVTDRWREDDQAPARMALAAHNMAAGGLLPQTGAAAIPAGVTRFRSASMDVGLSEAAANRALKGGYGSTVYGQEFAVMERRNLGAPRLVGACHPRFSPCAA